MGHEPRHLPRTSPLKQCLIPQTHAPGNHLGVLIKTLDKRVGSTKEEIDVLIQLIMAPLLTAEIERGYKTERLV